MEEDGLHNWLLQIGHVAMRFSAGEMKSIESYSNTKFAKSTLFRKKYKASELSFSVSDSYIRLKTCPLQTT